MVLKKSKNVFTIFSVILAVLILSSIGYASTVTRSFSTPVEPGNTVDVTLTVDIEGTEGFYIIDEIYPEGFTIADPTTANTDTTGHLKWFITSGIADTTFTYRLSAPSTEDTYLFDGTYIFSSQPTSELDILGQTDLVVGTAACTPDWECTSWEPAQCPQSGLQTRTCTDLNACGTDSGKPSEEQSCTPENPDEPPQYSTFNGLTTDFSAVADIHDVQNVILEKSAYGKIEFGSQSLDFGGLNLDSFVTIANNIIGIDSVALPGLNVPATITIYNLNLIEPKILVNGVACPPNNCNIISYESNTLVFSVQHFSLYSATEGTVPDGNAIDDLNVNYIRGKITVNGASAQPGTEYKVTVTSGPNAGMIFTGTVDQDIPSFLQGNGYFDTRDQKIFNTGNTVMITIPGTSASTTATLLNGGNGDFVTGVGLLIFDLDLIGPQISNIPDISIEEESTFTNPVIDLYDYAVDGDNSIEELVFSIESQTNSALAGCSISENRYISCNDPQPDANGQNSVTVKVTDPNLQSDTDVFIVSVTSVNDAPVLDFIPSQSLLEDEHYSYTVAAADTEGDTLTFTTNSSVILIGASTGMIDFTPTDSHIGSHSVLITVTDSNGGIDSQVVSFNIQNINDAPVFTTPSFYIAMEEDTSYTFDLAGHIEDVDNDYNQLAFNFVGGDNFTFDLVPTQDSLMLTITPLENYFGIADINVVMKDPYNDQATAPMRINVTPVNDLPKITSVPQPLYAVEAVEFALDIQASDVEDSDLNYYLLNPVVYGAIIGQHNGSIYWIPTYDQLGINKFAVEVNDSEFGSTQELFDVTVLSALDLANEPDVTIRDWDKTYQEMMTDISDGSDIYAKPGDILRFNLDVIDRQDITIDDISISLTAQGLNLKNTTDRFNIWPGNIKDKELIMQIPFIVNQDVYDLKLNGSGQDLHIVPRIFERDYKLHIVKDFHDIIINSVELEQETARCYKATDMLVTMTNIGALDEDDVKLTISNTELDMDIQDNIGNFDDNKVKTKKYLVDLRNAQPGTYDLDVGISYNNLDNATQTSVPLTIEECALPQDLTVQEDTTPPADWLDLWSYTSNGVDGSIFDYDMISQDSDLINCYLTKDSATLKDRYLSCDKPEKDRNGQSLINISLSRNSIISYLTTVVTVTQVNDAPIQIAPMPYTEFDEDTLYTSSWKIADFFEDADGDTLTYSSSGSQHISINFETDGSITLSPAPNFAGTEQMTITASDVSAFVDAILTVNVVEADDDAPVIDNIMPSPLPVIPNDGSLKMTANISDPDSNTLSTKWYVDGMLKGVGYTYTFIGDNSPGLKSFDIEVKVSDNTNTVTDSFTLMTTDAPYSEKYAIESTPESDLVMVNPGVAKIEILDPVDLSKIAGIDAFVILEQGKAGIDTTAGETGYDLSMLANKKARVTLYNVPNADIRYGATFSLNINDPLCPASKCKNITYDGSTLTFEVTSFSVFGIFTPDTGTGDSGTGSTAPPTSAAQIPTTSFLLGGADQDASNPDEGKEVIVTDTFMIKNTNNCTVTLSDIISVPKLGFTADDLLITKLSISPSTLLSGETATVQLSARIPESLDAVDENLKPTAFNTADIYFAGTRCSQQSSDALGVFNIMMQRENHLNIDKAEFDSGDNSEKADDGDKIDKIKPGDDFTLDITVENTFSDKDDVTIDDVEVSYIVDDNELDIDENEEIGRISADDDDSETLKFDIEDDAEDGTYDGILTTFGTDDYGARHGEVWKIDLKVEREDDELSIERFDISPNQLSCNNIRTIFASTLVRNIGKDDQNDASLSIEAPDFDFYEKVTGIELDEDDGTSKTFGIIPPKDISSGSYPITVKTFSDNGELMDSSSLYLIVHECADSLSGSDVKPIVTSRERSGVEESNIVLKTNNLRQPVYAHPPVRNLADEKEEVKTTKLDMSDVSSGYITLLIILFIIAFGLIIFVYGAAIILYKKRQRRRRMLRRKKRLAMKRS